MRPRLYHYLMSENQCQTSSLYSADRSLKPAVPGSDGISAGVGLNALEAGAVAEYVVLGEQRDRQDMVRDVLLSLVAALELFCLIGSGIDL